MELKTPLKKNDMVLDYEGKVGFVSSVIERESEVTITFPSRNWERRVFHSDGQYKGVARDHPEFQGHLFAVIGNWNWEMPDVAPCELETNKVYIPLFYENHRGNIRYVCMDLNKETGAMALMSSASSFSSFSKASAKRFIFPTAKTLLLKKFKTWKLAASLNSKNAKKLTGELPYSDPNAIIIGPGRYVTRGGDRVTIQNGGTDTMPYSSNDTGYVYGPDGRVFSNREDDQDIVRAYEYSAF